MNRSPGASNPNWRGGKATIVCENCRTPFEVIPSRKNKAKCCSLKCWNDLQSAQKDALLPDPRYSNKGKRTKTWVAVKCRQCSEPFEIKPSQVGLKVFCSQECHRRWRRIRNSGDGNPNWNGGTRSEKYPPEFFAIRSSILARDGNECAVPMCRTVDTRVGVHHIDYNKANCAPDNLIAACPSCNSRANFGRILWPGILNAFLAWRIDNGVMNIGLRGSIELNL